MQAVEFESIVRNHVIPVPASVQLASDTAVRIVVLYEQSKTPPLGTRADTEIADFFGCLPDFPDREPQGEYEKRLEID